MIEIKIRIYIKQVDYFVPVCKQVSKAWFQGPLRENMSPDSH